MADTSADAPQATSAEKRPFGRKAADVIPARGARKCKRCGALMHPDATHCPKGHSRAGASALERRVEEAIHLHRRGGGRYDPHLHPRNRQGEFRDTPDGPERTATPGQPRGSGAVVGGKVGRWVPIRGTKVHVPQEHEWERRFTDGVRFYSPAGSTEVHRVASGQDEVVSVPGAKITHPELQRTAPEGITTEVVRGAAPAAADPTPEPTPAAEPPTRRESARAAAAARDAIDRANPNAIPEPTEATEPGSLAGKDLTRVHPKAIDTELARLSGLSGALEHRWASEKKYATRDLPSLQARERELAAMAPDEVPPHRPARYGPDRPPNLMPAGERLPIVRGNIAQMQARLDAIDAEYRPQIDALNAEAQPFNDEFTRRGGWSRYFIVKNGNGHVHKSMECNTCFPTTEFGWLYELAGKNEHAMVQAYGESACSVCFPSAPSEYEAMRAAGQLSTQERATNAERDARNAERDARRAARAAKAITNPDGSPLRLSGRWGEEVKSLVTARTKLVDTINELRMWRGLAANGHQNGPAQVAEREADLELLVAAIAAKLSVAREKVMAEAQAKADVKWRRETWRH